MKILHNKFLVSILFCIPLYFAYEYFENTLAVTIVFVMLIMGYNYWADQSKKLIK